ncbi:hypothetical protein Taro_038000 [Colocasia esculenta]|uniref:Uncharacterized protein n=1 Tax=Colocasia esculenta TaxID=4460 RepID=A0A843W261_COLES|nr:hypothetical protein [Colocasia esculenta]
MLAQRLQQFVPIVPRYLCSVCSVLGEFPTEPVTSEAHPYSPQARARRRFLHRRPVRSRDVACVVSLARLRPVHGRRTRVKHITGLTGLDKAFRHNTCPYEITLSITLFTYYENKRVNYTALHKQLLLSLGVAPH